MVILGPANSLIYRMQDIYRKRIMIKFTNSKLLYPVLEKMSDFYNKKGNKVNVVCDFNPYNQIQKGFYMARIALTNFPAKLSRFLAKQTASSITA